MWISMRVADGGEGRIASLDILEEEALGSVAENIHCMDSFES